MSWSRSLALAALVGLNAAPAVAAPARYQLPPPELQRIVDAPLTPAVSVGPDQRTMLLMERQALPTIAQVSQPELRLAGLSINPRTNGEARMAFYAGLSFLDMDRGATRSVTGLPAAPRIAHVSWSPDGKQLAFTLTGAQAIELWLADVRQGKARRLSQVPLNAATGMPYAWFSDSRTLLLRAIPNHRGAPPAPPAAPAGPVVQESLGLKAPVVTYPNLLKNSQDEALFDHYLTAQLLVVDPTCRIRALGKPRVVLGAAPSPDGKFILVESVQRPYSYQVAIDRFPYRAEVWDREGQFVRIVANEGLAETVPLGNDAVREGPRQLGWRPDADAALCWAEAQDLGDPERAVAVRDRVLTFEAPFAGSPRLLAELGYRFAGAQWSREGLALIKEHWWKTRQERTWVLAPGASPRLLHERASEDRYHDPGTPVLRRTGHGTWVLATTPDRAGVYYTGEGASPEGNRPFLDRLELATGKTERLWQSQAPTYAFVAAVLDPAAQRLLVRRESPTSPPNYFLRDGSEEQQLTRFAHPTPALAGLRKEVLSYQRADGVSLSATLYLPPGYDPARQGPLPLVMWAYPREYKNAAAAGQVDRSPYAFDRISPTSPLVWLARGYAVLDDPRLPIIGQGAAEPNDTYVAQLVAGAQAAVDEVVRRGVADRRRIAVGGHSYGAFMTANLLAHSSLFAAGIARSGAYNRTLTPFGFQSEERTLWTAPATYLAMSPFVHADQIRTPLLLIHGEADSNPGTFPMQSERMFAALKGLGATTRLVILPAEEHGYRARESVLQMLYETDRWLETYVKRRKPE